MKTLFMLITFYTGPTADLGVLWGFTFPTRIECEQFGDKQIRDWMYENGTLADYLCIEVPND